MDELCSAPGWGLCLSHSQPGLDTPTFLAHMDSKTCGSVEGGFVAGMSHAPTGATACPAGKMMKFVKMMNFAFKMMNCVLQMMDYAVANHSLDNTCKTTGYSNCNINADLFF